jgi:hypothetical protein
MVVLKGQAANAVGIVAAVVAAVTAVLCFLVSLIRSYCYHIAQAHYL